MEKTDPKRSESDDGAFPSDTEKHVKAGAPAGVIDLPPDPDEGLTEEERKRIVRGQQQMFPSANC